MAVEQAASLERWHVQQRLSWRRAVVAYNEGAAAYRAAVARYSSRRRPPAAAPARPAVPLAELPAAPSHAAAPTPLGRRLTGRQREIALLVAEGMTNREIGARLHLSHYTVKDYLTRIMRKLGTRSRAETVARAVQQGLLAGRG